MKYQSFLLQRIKVRRVELWVPQTRTLIGTFSNGGESEGCVFDDENKTGIYFRGRGEWGFKSLQLK
jgi:hypothetical protein